MDFGLRLFWRGRPNKNNKVSSDMTSAADLKTVTMLSSPTFFVNFAVFISTNAAETAFTYDL